jgi:hypothetical protein
LCLSLLLRNLLLLLIKLEIENVFSGSKSSKEGVTDLSIKKILACYDYVNNDNNLRNYEKWVLEQNITQMLECCAELLEGSNAFLVLNLYSMGLSSTLARTAVRQCFGTPKFEQCGELYFEDNAGKELPLGTYYRFRR